MSLLREISEKGDGIYKAKYKRIYEKRYFGQYVAIDLETSKPSLRRTRQQQYEALKIRAKKVRSSIWSGSATRLAQIQDDPVSGVATSRCSPARDHGATLMRLAPL